MRKLVETSYSKKDVEVLLTDLSSKMEALGTAEREQMIQSGVHYSEMLPLEYKPTDEYMGVYERALEKLSSKTAQAIAVVSNILMDRHKGKFVAISLARAGLPVGILIKRYIKIHYGIDIPHYGISIIRGRGIDKNAMEFIREQNKDIPVSKFQFIDGWVGKGAITNILVEACNELQENTDWAGILPELAVLADPANSTRLCGTHEDFLIPSACLNSTVSGLVSRTILNSYIGENDFHGAVYFKEMEQEDRSIEFIDTVTEYLGYMHNEDSGMQLIKKEITTNKMGTQGIEVVKDIAKAFNIKDINFIKPGVGETTRVLLRRVPWKVLVDKNADTSEFEHIITLCRDKGIEIEEYDLGGYKACGIIKDVGADV